MAACGGDDGAGTTRTVENAFAGTTEVPTEPERVVALNGFAVLAAEGHNGHPAHGAGGEPDEDTPSGAWLVGRTGGVEVICCSTEPKLEEIVAQDTDLILATPGRPTSPRSFGDRPDRRRAAELRGLRAEGPRHRRDPRRARGRRGAIAAHRRRLAASGPRGMAGAPGSSRSPVSSPTASG